MARLNIEITATGVNKTDKAIKSVSDNVDRLDAEINSVQKTLGAFSRQQMALQGQMRNLNNSFNQGVISQDRYESESKQLGLQLSSVGSRIQSLNSNLTSLKATQNQLTNSTRSLGTSTGQLQAYSNDFTSGIRSSNAVAIEFSRVVQDMPYGMQGVANNLQQLTQNWSYYARAAREAAAAQGKTVSTMALMRGTLSSLLSPLNLLTLGISLITAGWVAYERYQQRANKAMREGQKGARDYAETLNDLSRSLHSASQSYGRDIARMQTLMAVVKSATATQKQRNDALKEMQEMYPAVFSKYNTETILTEAATKAYKELTASIIAAANARAAEGLIVEKASQQLALREENKERQKQIDLLSAQIDQQQRLTDVSVGGTGVGESVRAGNVSRENKLLSERGKLQEENTNNLLEHANLQENINDLSNEALNNQLKVNGALLDTSKNTGNAVKNARDYADAIAKVFDFDTSGASLINMTYTNAEIQKVRNEYEKLINNVDRLEKEGLRRNKENENERTRIIREAESERSEIRKAQSLAVADAIYRQDTAALIKSLNEQRDIYDSYEQWRKDLGEESANERYGAELATIRAFASRLETELASLAAKSMITDGLTDAEQQRFEDIDKMLKDFYKNRESEENKHLTALLKAYGTFEQKRKQLAEQYYKDIEFLNDGQRKNREREYAEDLAKVLEKEINQSEAFKNMDFALDFGSLKKSKAAVRLAQEFIADFFENFVPTSAQEAAAARELEESINSSLKQINVALDAENFDVVTDLVVGFEKLVDQAVSFDDSMVKSLKTISSMVSVVGDIANTLAKSSKNPLFQNIAGSAGIIGGVLGVIGGVAGAIEQRQARKAAEQAERMQKQNEQSIRVIDSMTKSLQRQLEVIELIYGIERVTEWQRVSNEAAANIEKSLAGMSDIIVQDGPASGAVEALRRFGLDTVSELDDEIDRLEKRIKKNKWNPFVNVSKDQMKLFELKNIKTLLSNDVIPPYEFGWKKISDITQEGAEQIRKDIEEGKFDEVTAKELSSMLDEWQIYMNAQRKLVEELTGTSFEALGDGLVDIFTRGDSAMEDFEKNFDELMRKSMIQSLKRSIMAEALKGWYERFADFAQSGGGLTESEISQLQQDYQAIGQQIKTNAENLEKATGISLSDPAESDRAAKGLTGSIERMSEQTGSELTGLYRATFELNKQELTYVQRLAVSNDGILVAVQESADVLADIASTNAEIAENTSHLESIAEAVERVARNTDNKSLRDIGL